MRRRGGREGASERTRAGKRGRKGEGREVGARDEHETGTGTVMAGPALTLRSERPRLFVSLGRRAATLRVAVHAHGGIGLNRCEGGALGTGEGAVNSSGTFVYANSPRNRRHLYRSARRRAESEQRCKIDSPISVEITQSYGVGRATARQLDRNLKTTSQACGVAPLLSRFSSRTSSFLLDLATTSRTSEHQTCYSSSPLLSSPPLLPSSHPLGCCGRPLGCCGLRWQPQRKIMSTTRVKFTIRRVSPARRTEGELIHFFSLLFPGTACWCMGGSTGLCWTVERMYMQATGTECPSKKNVCLRLLSSAYDSYYPVRNQTSVWGG
eukprot:3922033-Rhodomonas_salina.1